MKKSDLNNQKKIFISLYCILTLINLIMFYNIFFKVGIGASSYRFLILPMATLTIPTFSLYAMISIKLLKEKSIFFKIIIWVPLLMNLYCLWFVIGFLHGIWQYLTRPVNLHWYIN